MDRLIPTCPIRLTPELQHVDPRTEKSLAARSTPVTDNRSPTNVTPPDESVDWDRITPSTDSVVPT